MFLEYGIRILLESDSAEMIAKSADYVPSDLEDVQIEKVPTIYQKADAIVCCGGDGTLLKLVRESFTYEKPIIGIAGGTLSFLLSTRIDDIDKFMVSLFEGKCRIDKHLMFKAMQTDKHDQEMEIFKIFNDIIVKNKDPIKTVKINVFLNNQLISTFLGDGLIISTPTGSTAYNLSAKGPIVYPLNEALILTPINPHGLTLVPLVLPFDFDISVQAPNGDGIFICDGMGIRRLAKKDKVTVVESKYKVKMVHRKEHEYLNTLKEKLSWGR